MRRIYASVGIAVSNFTPFLFCNLLCAIYEKVQFGTVAQQIIIIKKKQNIDTTVPIYVFIPCVDTVVSISFPFDSLLCDCPKLCLFESYPQGKRTHC
jgi:hypothetical protein